MIYYHGGGWCVGTAAKTHFQQAVRMAQITQMTVVSVEYSLAPEYPFSETGQCAFTDCYRATKAYVNAHKIDNYLLSGDSAGGNLSTVVCMKMSENPNDIYAPPKLLALWYPFHCGMNFGADCVLKNDLPTLSIEMGIAFKLAYMGGLVDEEVVDIVRENPLDLYNWIDDEKEAVRRAKIDEIDNYVYRPRKFPSKKIEAQAKKIIQGYLSKFSSPGYCSDEAIKLMLNFVKKGMVIQNSEHDILHEDVNRWMERLQENNEGGKLLRLVKHEGVTHGFTTVCCDLEKQLPNAFALFRRFCEDIRDEMK